MDGRPRQQMGTDGAVMNRNSITSSSCRLVPSPALKWMAEAISVHGLLFVEAAHEVIERCTNQYQHQCYAGAQQKNEFALDGEFHRCP